MRLLIALLIFMGSVLCQDIWQERRDIASEVFQLHAEMKHNALVEQDEQKWDQQLERLRQMGADIVIEQPDVDLFSVQLQVLIDSYENRSYAAKEEAVYGMLMQLQASRSVALIDQMIADADILFYSRNSGERIGRADTIDKLVQLKEAL